MTPGEAHTRYLAHLQQALNEAHDWHHTCWAAGTAPKPPASPEQATLPRTLPMARACAYIKIAWGVKLSEKKIKEAIRASAEKGGQGKFTVPVYGPGYVDGVGHKPISYDRFTLDSLDEVAKKLVDGL